MWQNVLSSLELLDYLIWRYLAFILVLAVGISLSYRARFYQLKVLRNISKTFRDLAPYNSAANKSAAGTNPIKLYFASIGGMIGTGNIATVTAVVTIGGPGGIIWMWLAVLVGMLIKYSDIYLGVTHRIKNHHNNYDGGPMYYLKKAYGNNFMPKLYAILLCVYGVEISQFVMISDSLSSNLNISREIIVAILLALIFYVTRGGVKRLANTCTLMMPPFLVLYIIMCVWVIVANGGVFLEFIPIILKSALVGHSAVGGFAGSTMLLAAHYGTSKAVYTGDIGIGYDSIINSETRADSAKKQARLSIIALANNALICTLSCLVVLVSGLWKSADQLKPTEYVVTALSTYFPYIKLFMSVLFFLAGFTTIIAYLVVGMKSARFLSPVFGERIYGIYAAIIFILLSFSEQEQMIAFMSLTGGLLMLVNLPGIFKLRHEIKFR